MRSTPRAAFAARALALLSILSSTLVHATPSTAEDPSSTLERRAVDYVGCFSSSGSLTAADSYIYQSSSYCAQKECGGQAVIGLTNGNGCYCGNSVPPSSNKVDDSKCNVGCTGFGQVACGGNGFFSVYTTGSGTLVSNGDSSSSSDASSTTSSPSSTSANPTTVVTTSVGPNQTVFVTQAASSSSSPTGGSSSGGGGGSNTAGIAAGVVVGLVVVAAIIGGLFFWLRRRRQLAIEEEHRQRSQVSDFIGGGAIGGMHHERKGLGSSYSHRSDARLDPEAGGMRRNSVGSFVEDDSHDYSRKVLRVANPDSS